MPREMRSQIEVALAALGRYEFGQGVDVIVQAERLMARCAGQAQLEEMWRSGLLALLRSESQGAGQAAAKLLSFVGPGQTVEALRRMLGESDARQVEIARLALASSRSLGGPPPAAPAGYRALFDGETLDGWVVDTASVWSVRNGVIVGASPGLKYNEFLRTRGEYYDFHLHVKLKLIRGVGNTGVQFRSGPAAVAHEVAGYQADGGERFWGALYDESRRKRILASPSAEFVDRLDPGAWHSYDIVAKGASISIRVDGAETVNYVESEAEIARVRGFIALQVHSHPRPIEVWFRDVWIREG